MFTNHYRFFQKKFSGYNLSYIFNGVNVAKNVNLITPGIFTEPTTQNFAQLVFQVGTIQTVTANITIVGFTDANTKITQVVQITPSTTPIDTGTPTLASHVNVPIYLNSIESIVTDQPLENLYLGYYSQYGVYTSDGGITSQAVSILGSLPSPNVTWTLLGSLYQFSQPYSPNPPARNFYPFNADTTNVVVSTPYLLYINNPVGKFKLQIDPTSVTVLESADVLWEVGFRNYL